MALGDYEVLEEVCRNEWSVVRRARRRSDGKPVLLKLPCGHPPRPLDAELLEREAAIARDLALPGIVRVHALERQDGITCLVLEDRGEVTLQTLLASRTPDLELALKVAIQLATSLAELHRSDLVHQNLNPRSILIHPGSGELRLGDFSFAAKVSGESVAPLSKRLLRSALPYVSPEQTGRMNRAVDYRTDLYSLGVVLYELLTGAPPFRADDALELIHSHIAKTPPAPVAVDARVPEQLSRMVMKLLAKTAEERYQSALGLKADLETCQRQWTTQGRVDEFPVGQRDVSDRFLIPRKLYGRSSEVDELLRAFDRTCTGATEMMVVGGYSGIGKTSLIQELYKPIVRERGYFIAGKFDPIVRNVPHGALIQAFRSLLQQLLTESEARLSRWRTRLSEALGANAGVLAEVIPEIELVLGKQPPPPALAPTEAQNRFQLVFQNFVGTLAQREHPLVVFVDDLQWADSATLSLLGPLLTSPRVKFLFLIGAYRDNEVDASHLLMRTLTALESAGAQLRRLALEPLRLPDVQLLMEDALRREPSDVEPLAALVLRKTDGNPFFVLQFLKSLRQEGLLELDRGRGFWTFRIEAVAGAATTDNVIDLMTRKIQRLPPRTQRALTLAACIGNPFDASTLAIVSQQSVEAVARDLEEALDEGLILSAPSEAPAYGFLHDRVQQAAYALIPADRKQLAHLTVGRLLRERWDPATTGQRLFDIAQHLNLGRSLITGEAERLALARLDLAAGRKAKSATAFQVALGYFSAGLTLLGENHWSTEYELAFALHLEAAECEYLCGSFEEAERVFDRLLTKARTKLDKAKIYSLKILQYEHTSRYADAIRSGLESLALFGLSFPALPEERQAALERELSSIKKLMAGRTIGSLIDLPTLQEPEMRAVMQLCANLHTSCFLSGDKPLTLLNNAAMVRLSLVHGNTAESAYAYVLHAAMLVGPIQEDYRSAYEFGQLALSLNERLYDPALRSKVLMMFAWSISLWRMPLEASFPVTQESFRLGHETGLFVDAAWALFNEIWFALLICQDLASFQKVYRPSVDYSERIQMRHIADAKRVLLQWGRALQGSTESPTSLTDGSFDEDAYRRTYQGQRLFEMFYCAAKLALLYTFDEVPAACEAARTAELVIGEDFRGTIWDELRVFYEALALSRSAGAEDGLAALEARLRKWAENSPHNFQPQHLIVSAEIARLQRSDADAARLYEAAIEAAARYQRPREKALANELYAKFWRDRGNAKVAAVFMADARDCYAQWGAKAKVEHLERTHADLLPARDGGKPAQTASEGGTLDFETIMKAAQAISGEIELEKLLARLMRIAMENAGAERGRLILERGGEPFVYAEGSIDAAQVNVHGAVPLNESEDLANSVVHYVRRTLESLVLADARTDDRYGQDPYVLRFQPRSILCTPVLTQGRLVAVLYLENNLAANAFTPDRIELMQVLASGAAISLENARLYDEMKKEVAARRKAEEDLRAALGEVESLKNRLHAENVYLQEEIQGTHNFVEMVGTSPALLAALGKIEQVAPTDSTVLISGETGTGKELVARAIHSRSARRDRPLVKVNCSAISAGLVESELFGHVKGAFTGALERRTGRFELADGGTIFLDEVGELPLETQVKLLRVLQEQEFEQVGSSKSIRVDVRVIAATNRNLDEAIRAGRFRADLYYRLNVFPLNVPPLRERMGDVRQLAMYFLSRFAKRFGKKVDAVSEETMERLVSYPWPGNIRELQNVIERAVILAHGPVLELDRELAPVGVGAGPAPAAAAVSAPGTLEDVERGHILAVLSQTAWVIGGPKGAARILNLHPNTLRSRMEKLGIKRAHPEVS